MILTLRNTHRISAKKKGAERKCPAKKGEKNPKSAKKSEKFKLKTMEETVGPKMEEGTKAAAQTSGNKMPSQVENQMGRPSGKRKRK